MTAGAGFVLILLAVVLWKLAPHAIAFIRRRMGAGNRGGSVWGKIIGGTIGLGLGGPIGLVVGAVAGHFAVDRQKASHPGSGGAHGPNFSREERQVAFAVAVVALSAKLAKADGQVTRDEVAALKHIFHLPKEAEATIGAIFNEARKDATGFEPYAQQLVEIFGARANVLEELLAALLLIAHADGTYHSAERRMIATVARLFGFGETEFARIEATFTQKAGQTSSDPYIVLGLTRQASDTEIRATYRKLLQENHPDRLMAQGLPEDFVEVANRKMAEINAAYDRIKKERGIR
jgi:DnaJ like chaperone protein